MDHVRTTYPAEIGDYKEVWGFKPRHALVRRRAPFDSFLYAVDILGYSFMSMATMFAAMLFTGGGVNRVVRRFLMANGLLGRDISRINVVARYAVWSCVNPSIER